MSYLPFERAFRAWTEREGMGWDEFSYARPEAGGDVRAYRLTPAGHPRAVVLTVHGAGNDALFGMVGLSKLLLRRGFEIFAFDLDGHGRRSTTRFFPEAVASAIPAAVEIAGAERRGLPLHALGISLGGSLLLHALPALSPTLVSATLFCAPLHIRLTRRSVSHEAGPALLRTIWRERRDYGLTGLIPSFGPFKRRSYPLRLGVAPGPGAFGYVDVLNLALDGLPLLGSARHSNLPVLLFYGEADNLVPLENGERIARSLPEVELNILQGETHLPLPFAPRAVSRFAAWLESNQQ